MKKNDEIDENEKRRDEREIEKNEKKNEKNETKKKWDESENKYISLFWRQFISILYSLIII